MSPDEIAEQVEQATSMTHGLGLLAMDAYDYLHRGDYAKATHAMYRLKEGARSLEIVTSGLDILTNDNTDF